MDWKTVAWVALGGAIGAVARFGVAQWLPRDPFPFATLAVNLVGAFLLGWLVFGQSQGTAYFFLGVGVLGAFTTLSTYGVETISLWNDGKVGLAAANVLANGIGGPLFALIGAHLR